MEKRNINACAVAKNAAKTAISAAKYRMRFGRLAEFTLEATYRISETITDAISQDIIPIFGPGCSDPKRLGE
jgi:hypothetical protein